MSTKHDATARRKRSPSWRGVQTATSTSTRAGLHRLSSSGRAVHHKDVKPLTQGLTSQWLPQNAEPAPARDRSRHRKASSQGQRPRTLWTLQRASQQRCSWESSIGASRGTVQAGWKSSVSGARGEAAPVCLARDDRGHGQKLSGSTYYRWPVDQYGRGHV